MDGLDRTLLSQQHSRIRASLDQEGGLIREAHRSGANGGDIVQRRTELIDRTLREVYRLLEGSGPMPALLAVGGYGRGELNPYSDIDILFLCRGEADRQRSPEMLYVLWDAGLDVGYSVRSIPECVELGRNDIKIRTSLMESRLIAGDPTLYTAFLKSMYSEVFFQRVSSFVTDKIAERRTSRQKYGGSVYLREPNIKEGAGGLRDFHTAFWVAFARFRASSLEDLIAPGIITAKQYAVFLRSRNFLWRVRNEVHYLSGRKNDHLTFDLQERAAADFGYRDSAHLLAVERFMKAYFLHARNIREFSNIIMSGVLPKPARRWYTRSLRLGPFSLIGRTLVPASDDLFQKDPGIIMTAFGILQSHRAVFSDKLKSMIRGQRIDDAIRMSPSAVRDFLSLLNNPDNLFETLSLMKDLRFLGRFIPEFRPIEALAKHDYYHKYTVDEHILLAIRSLQDLWAGRYPSLSSLSDALRSVRKRWVLMLTVLLHDLGKAFRADHERRGAEIAETILTRFGIADEEQARILFLIRNHLLMSGLSQRRELSDRKVIADFSRQVRDRETLTMLYLLTYADISAVNPTAWTQWKAVLLQDLYLRTLVHLDKSAVATDEERVRIDTASEKIKEAALPRFSPGDVDAFLADAPLSYLLHTAAEKAVHHLWMMKRLPKERLVIEHRHDPEKGYTELTVCAYDAYGMLSRASGTLAAKNLNILRAQAYTTKSGVMIDTFQITDPDGNIYTYEDAWESVKSELRAALTSEYRPAEPGVYIAEKTVLATQAPSVEFDNDSSDSFTIIDINARDKVGLLYRMTRTLFELNLDIASAKIVTEGTRVLDSFYVTDLLKKKILDSERTLKIREALLKALE